MERRLYGPDDMRVLPWPHPQNTGGEEVTEWALEIAQEVGASDLELVKDRLCLADPALAVRATKGGARVLVLAFHWQAYDGEALSRSAQALQLVSQVLDLVSVQGVDKHEWPFLRGESP